MKFNITIKALPAGSKIKPDSALIAFLPEKKVEERSDLIEKSFKITLNKSLRDKFKSEETDEISLYREEGIPDKIFFKKIKIDDKFNSDFFRNYLSGVVERLKKESLVNIYLVLPEFNDVKSYYPDESYFYQTVFEGIYLGNYSFDVYKSEEKKKSKKLQIFYSPSTGIIQKAQKKAERLIESVVFARDLVNEPAITLTPSVLALRTGRELKKFGVKVTVFNNTELKKRNMKAVLAVGKASTNPPNMIILNYKPKTKAKRKIALVGKGVTYDSGGLSIKPTAGMLEMKADMAGAATVIGTIRAAAEANLPVEIIGVIPAVENMVSGNSYKPGDVIGSASGKTIEVKDTDAEGRIILADALDYASRQKPDEIIDFATLTGAVAVALGLFTSGLFTKNEDLAREIYDAGQRTYEFVWRLPFWTEYDKLIESDIADVSNLGPRWGGAITAGKFLEHFVDKNIPWAHIDMAGPALKHDLTNYTKKFCTGYGVRLMFDYLSRK